MFSILSLKQNNKKKTIKCLTLQIKWESIFEISFSLVSDTDDATCDVCTKVPRN